jgi:ADP-heptose:LPS heptosyltransferase
MISIEAIARLCVRINPFFVSRIINTLSSSRWFNHILERGENRCLSAIHNPTKILVIADVNIGDAVLVQSIVAILKGCIPNLRVSYLYQHMAFPLIKANPFVDEQLLLFRNFGLPSEEDIKNVRETIERNDFDLIINICPFIPNHVFKKLESCVIQPFRLIAEIIRAYNSHNHKAHLVFQLNKHSNRIVNKIDSYLKPSDQTLGDLKFPYIFADKKLQSRTKAVMDSMKIPSQAKKVLFNPDSSSKFTLIPFQFQKELLKGILSSDNLDVLLLNSGRTFEGIEKRLLNEIPSYLRKKVVLIPKNTEIDIFAGLVDNVNLIISGDTAPLHIAAARKYIVGSSDKLNNSTAMVGIFGATSAKVYGYDSFIPGYFPSPQNAPSKVFEAFPPCKNLICLNKKYKTCKDIRCFEGLRPEQVVQYARNILS